MRRHYESLNYLDAQPGMETFKFTRTKDANDGYMTLPAPYYMEETLTRTQVEMLRDMLTEVLEDWE